MARAEVMHCTAMRLAQRPPWRRLRWAAAVAADQSNRGHDRFTGSGFEPVIVKATCLRESPAARQPQVAMSSYTLTGWGWSYTLGSLSSCSSAACFAGTAWTGSSCGAESGELSTTGHMSGLHFYGAKYPPQRLPNDEGRSAPKPAHLNSGSGARAGITGPMRGAGAASAVAPARQPDLHGLRLPRGDGPHALAAASRNTPDGMTRGAVRSLPAALLAGLAAAAPPAIAPREAGQRIARVSAWPPSRGNREAAIVDIG
jgi:hypothetical protein